MKEGMAVHSQYSCLQNSHGQRSLVDYTPWGHKELGTTEQLSIQREATDSRLAYGAPSSGNSAPEGEAGVTPVSSESEVCTTVVS